MDRKNFKDEVFTELPELIICSNFRNCTFKAKTKFERCNLIGCTFEVECEFDRSNVIDEEDIRMHRRDEVEEEAVEEVAA